MNVETLIDPTSFVDALRPALESRDMNAVLDLCKNRWTCSQIAALLSSDHADARKVASVALALVGCSSCLQDISEQLRDPDPLVNQLAEHALWSIWFRGGSPEAINLVARGAKLIGRRDFERAIMFFNRAIDLSPTFAEAFNQRAIAKYLQDDYTGSIQDCRRATALMPIHFGAWSGMGHCHAHEGNIAEAIRCYQRALKIHPHLHCIREALEELQDLPHE